MSNVREQGTICINHSKMAVAAVVAVFVAAVELFRNWRSSQSVWLGVSYILCTNTWLAWCALAGTVVGYTSFQLGMLAISILHWEVMALLCHWSRVPDHRGQYCTIALHLPAYGGRNHQCFSTHFVLPSWSWNSIPLFLQMHAWSHIAEAGAASAADPL